MTRERTLELCVSATVKMLQRARIEASIFNARYRLTSAFAVRTARGSVGLTGQGSSSACAMRYGGRGNAAPPTWAPRALGEAATLEGEIAYSSNLVL